VPIGMGSGMCGVIAARDALGLNTRASWVVSKAPCIRAFIRAGHVLTRGDDTSRMAWLAGRRARQLSPSPDAVPSVLSK
jgi:threonine dehydratase